MNLNDKIYIAGHRGLVGSAIVRQLESRGFTNLLMRTHKDLDLTNQAQVQNFFKKEKPDYVILTAAKVGGIHANGTYPAEFIYSNLTIQGNVIHSAYENNIKRLLFLGSSCIYPKFALQPMREESLLTGILEETNEPYAVAKIAGIKMCESYNRQYNTDFRSAMPTNLYGPGDTYHLKNSHVIPVLMRKFHEAKISNNKTVSVWGSGKVKREFLFVDDLAEACVHLICIDKEKYQSITEPMVSHVNIGFGKDVTIKELAKLIQKIVGFEGDIVWDRSKPDGVPRKLLNSSKINQLGWKAQTTLENGLIKTYKLMIDNK
jgi:GDP-L-fucose synthase